MNLSNHSEDPPVTVDVLQQVKAGREAEFEQILNELIDAAQRFDGHLGVNIFRQTNHCLLYTSPSPRD